MNLGISTLGQCGSRADAIFKIFAWKNGAKSFTIKEIVRYNYSVVSFRKNYFSVVVEYFSTIKEGKYKIPNYPKNSLDLWRDCFINKKRILL